MVWHDAVLCGALRCAALQASKIVFVLRSCDYDEEVILKGLACLSQILTLDSTRPVVRPAPESVLD